MGKKKFIISSLFHMPVLQVFKLKTLHETLESTTTFQTFGLSSLASPLATNLKKFNIINFDSPSSKLTSVLQYLLPPLQVFDKEL